METTKVVVIGAGPSGLAVGACLQQRQIDFIILEKEHQVGSSWRRHYERLHLHTIKSRSSLPLRSFDPNYPRYVPGSLLFVTWRNTRPLSTSSLVRRNRACGAHAGK